MSIDFSDGNTFFAILQVCFRVANQRAVTELCPPQCILPCITQYLPPNDPLIHCIAWYQAYRILIGLDCVGGTQQAYVQDTVIPNYNKYCNVRVIVSFAIYY